MRNLILLLITAGLVMTLVSCSEDTPVSPNPSPSLTGEYAGEYIIETTSKVIEMYTSWRFSKSGFQMRCIDTLDYDYIACADCDGSYSLNEGVNYGVTFEVNPDFMPCLPDIEPDGHFDFVRNYEYLHLLQGNKEKGITKTITLHKTN